jgi:hypothetical protein
MIELPLPFPLSLLLFLSLALFFWRWHKRSHDGLMIDVRVAVWPTALLPPPDRRSLSLSHTHLPPTSR